MGGRRADSAAPPLFRDARIRETTRRMGDAPPMPKPLPQRDGYLVVLRPEIAYAAYAAQQLRFVPDPAPLRALWNELRNALPRVDPLSYAGWDREPVDRATSERAIAAWPGQRAMLIASLAASGVDASIFPQSIRLPSTNAERLMLERLGEDPTTTHWDVRFVNPCVIPDLAIALEVLAATEDSDRWEVIRVVRIPEESRDAAATAAAEATETHTLGFDVGYWGGSFSLLSDTMTCPRWHPAPPEHLADLRTYAETLNTHVLFPTAEAARRFRAWYRAQPWAETEAWVGEYVIARIDRV
jgi:hypothetical protein